MILLNKTVALLAKRNSGKLCLLKYLVSAELRMFIKISVVCPPEKINRFYSDSVDDKSIMDCYGKNWVDN